jgi:hypothetical protein
VQPIDVKVQKALECPCVADLKSGPCGSGFIDAFSCFLRSTEVEKVVFLFQITKLLSFKFILLQVISFLTKSRVGDRQFISFLAFLFSALTSGIIQTYKHSSMLLYHLLP